MKCVAALSLTLASMVQAHYTFPYYITPSGNVTGQWEYVRETANHYSNGPVTDVNSTAIACYQLTSGDEGAETASVQAGGSYTSSSGDSCQFPGCYTGYEAGILFDIYYPVPTPMSCSDSSSAAAATNSATSATSSAVSNASGTAATATAAAGSSGSLEEACSSKRSRRRSQKARL